MRTADAAELINSTAFKPGWRARAATFDDRRIYLTLLIDTVDTSYPDSEGQCHRKIALAPDTLIDVSGLNDEGVLYAVLKFAREVNEHEDREFLKVLRDGRWVAPFHPHTPEGNRAWATQELVSQYR